MGALVSPLIALPDADAAGRLKYALVYQQLTDLNLSTPVDPPTTVTKDALEDVLQGHLGDRLGDEIANDPTAQGYSGQTDAQIRALLLDRPTKAQLQFPGSAERYEVTAASTVLGVEAAIAPGLTDPGFNSLFPGVPVEARALARFQNNTATAALRGQFQSVFLAPTSGTLNFAAPFPATPQIGDRFQLFKVPTRRRNPPRWYAIAAGIPYANNDLTVADVTAAQV